MSIVEYWAPWMPWDSLYFIWLLWLTIFLNSFFYNLIMSKMLYSCKSDWQQNPACWVKFLGMYLAKNDNKQGKYIGKLFLVRIEIYGFWLKSIPYEQNTRIKNSGQWKMSRRYRECHRAVSWFKQSSLKIWPIWLNVRVYKMRRQTIIA